MKPEHKQIFEALTDQQLFALNMEREARGEPYEGKIAVGTVVLERVDHRDWDGDTIKEVILKPWQFSWTMPEAGKAYYNRAIKMASQFDEYLKKSFQLKECYDIAGKMLSGEIPRDPDLAKVHCCQYLNPETAPKAKEEWIQRGFKVIKRINSHEFFI